MTGKAVKIGLMGCGTVGSGVVKTLLENKELIAQRLGCSLEIKKILELNADRVTALGLDASLVTTDYQELIGDPEIEIVVELMGGIEPARTFMLEALKQGKNVVTANKDVVALHGRDLLETAEEMGKDFCFEASVGGGIPIIGPLKQSLAANKIEAVLGIVNGTTNYILTKMARDGKSFEEVLEEARKLGYAEADPTSDIEGYDAARKVAILASIAFGTRVTFSDVYVEGITKVTPQDLEYGRDLGYALKLLAIAKEENQEIEVRVHPAFIPIKHPLAAVNDVFNAIFIRGNFVGEVMHYGQGAGQRPTASAVVGDIMEVARNIRYGSNGRISCTCFYQKRIKPISEINTRYYIRMMVKDCPGVLAGIAGVFGNQQVSLAKVLQEQSQDKEAEVVFITHKVQEGSLMDALKILEGMSMVKSISNVIRLENDNE